MEQVAIQFPAKVDSSEAIVQDFHTFRQALNVASADQRVLVLVHAPKEQEKSLRESLRQVTNDERIVGRFHFDFDPGEQWSKTIENAKPEPGIMIIRPGEFGLKGTMMSRLPLDADPAEVTKALLKANQQFAKSTEKKVYSDHVAKGRAQGIYFEGAVPYGEDRDGDGEIDRGRSGRGSRRR